MAGCTRPGPACGETKEPEDGLPGGGRAGSRPIATRTGSGGRHKLEGWPRKISWMEFREVDERPEGVVEDAEIYSETVLPKQVRWRQVGTSYRLEPFTAKVVLVRDETWVVKGTQSDMLLSHEQGHFDITGLSGRDLLRALSKLTAGSESELMEKAEREIKRIQALATRITDEYDTQTDHNRKPAEQKRWKKHIERCITTGLALSSAP